MKILVFDTETTGLPTERNAPIISTHKWPYIVQLSYILYDTDQNTVLECNDKIIKLFNGIRISRESENIHKISNEMSQTKGVDIKAELIEFNKMILRADILVAHNISFDKQMILVECIRNKILQNFTINNIRKPEFCTMKYGTNIAKIIAYGRDGHTYFKYPKLIELYRHLFDCEPKGLHNSLVDVLACLRCYGKMKYDVDYNELSKDLNAMNVIHMVPS